MLLRHTKGSLLGKGCDIIPSLPTGTKVRVFLKGGGSIGFTISDCPKDDLDLALILFSIDPNDVLEIWEDLEAKV